MSRMHAVAAALLAFALPVTSFAQVSVSDAWVRSTVPGQQVTGAFMKLAASSDASLVGAASPVAGRVEIHESSMHGGVMQMREVRHILLSAGKSVELKPGGYHVMLMAMKQQLNAGDSVPITLTFEDKAGKRTSVDVQAAVRSLSGTATKHSH